MSEIFDEGDEPIDENELLKDRMILELDGFLQNFNVKDMLTFAEDFYLVFKIYEEIEKNYGEMGTFGVQEDLGRFRKMISEWNLKYRDILLEVTTDSIECNLWVYLREKNINEIIPVLRKMKRLHSIKKLKTSPLKIEAMFGSVENENENSLILLEDGGRIKIIYLREDMLLPHSPEFRFAAYYAMKDGFDRRINIRKYSSEFSFHLPKATSGCGWLSYYNSRKNS
ncbi:MAG: hypothetical protein KKF44_09190 [Nanoarchaeota archaeon]|nr:hypothetical protein [Nanoarchaeota archaeon]